MRKFAIIALLLMAVVAPVSAFSPRESNLSTNLASIAWYDGTELNVAVANTANTRTTVTISTPTVDSRGRQVFSNLRVDVPGRTIVEETFYPTSPRRSEQIVVRVSEGYRSTDIPVQITSIMDPESYIVPANTHWTVAVDLDFLLQDSGRTRLVVDDYYQTADGYNQDRIRIESLQGGLSQGRGNSNTIEYVKPSMVLTMKTPQVSTLTTMTFNIRKTDGFNWRDEEFQGPLIMVYGRNMRYVGSSSGSGRTSR
ncbi:MAG TPA: hypothetical protein DDZ66_06000 [Firmicutes bacterium]|jgi:hypothetical protein|nr:hypothetical protein [Bacillota bacterium]